MNDAQLLENALREAFNAGYKSAFGHWNAIEQDTFNRVRMEHYRRWVEEREEQLIK